ncbi:acyl-CoA dehydrogenase family protein [Lipingzhangella sp. LS1_29]|uniref:Acyl-CoA dehydrogenase family protein n=2 Tax=Lipingzhangella rawalii TaxID=2055835 RepID=A0ABU2HC02_9ACTN|nr:acyl-CoA dehydrogenase family protein [Lipingzhangella rawalii]
MPNVAGKDLPLLTVVAARLIVDGEDEGVFPFVVPLRTEDGTAPGVHILEMPDKGFAPMDNALIRFNQVPVPEHAWLTGGTAWFDAAGRFACSIPDLKDRFRQTVQQLRTGRVMLAAGTLAAARAGLWLTYDYALQRRTAGDVPMIERDNVALGLLSCLSRVYAASAFGNAVRARLPAQEEGRLTGPEEDAKTELLCSLAKPLLSWTARDVLQECRERCGAQGMFRANRIPDYLGITQAVITAEGENQVLQISAGRSLAARVEGESGWAVGADQQGTSQWHGLLRLRERILAEESAHAGWANTHALDLADAAATRMAAQSLHEEAERAPDAARRLLHTLGVLYAAEQVRARAGWFAAHAELSAERAEQLTRDIDQAHTELLPRMPELMGAFGFERGSPRSLMGRNDVDEWVRLIHT